MEKKNDKAIFNNSQILTKKMADNGQRLKPS